jgi:hypothetical protein
MNRQNYFFEVFCTETPGKVAWTIVTGIGVLASEEVSCQNKNDNGQKDKWQW